MEQKSYTYKLQGIDLIEKSLTRLNVKDGDQFNFNVRTQSAIEDIKNLVIVVIEVNITKSVEPKIIARFVCAFGFEITDMDKSFEKTSDNKYILPTDFENLLKSISISTMRGIIFSELRGTAMHGTIMPVILMDSLKPEAGSLIDDLKNNN